jgi:hypothetical protein
MPQANAQERVAQVDSKAPLGECLAHRTLVEFPTLHVRVRSPP